MDTYKVPVDTQVYLYNADTQKLIKWYIERLVTYHSNNTDWYTALSTSKKAEYIKEKVRVQYKDRRCSHLIDLPKNKRGWTHLLLPNANDFLEDE